MSDSTSSSPAADDMHWGISYLREDIQDLRQEMRALHARIVGLAESVNGRIDGLAESVNGRFEAVHQRIDTKFGQLMAVQVTTTGILLGAMVALFQFYQPG
jgi:hypothetical protein